MGQLLQGTAADVIGGPARLLIAPATYPMPGRITEIVNIGNTNYPVNSTYGWVDVGFTEVGITMQHEVSEKQIRTDQFGLLKTLPLDYQELITTRAMQINQANKKNIMQASLAADNAATPAEHVTYFEATPYLSVWRCAIVMQDDQNRFHARVYPHVQWDGKAQKELFERATPDTIDFTLVGYPDSAVIGPNGFAALRVDFDQP